MASFNVTTSTTAAQNLAAGELGFIDRSGSILASGTAVTMAWSSSLAVLGSIVTGSTLAPAVEASEGGIIQVGATGSIMALRAKAIAFTNLGTAANLINAGTITATQEVITVTQAGLGSFSLLNTGQMLSSSTMFGDIRCTAITIINHGTLSGSGSGTLSLKGDFVIVENSGTMSGLDFVAGPQARGASVVNTGTITGSVLLGATGDFYDGALGQIGGSIFGNGGNDRVTTGIGANRIYGGLGNDTLDGGAGNDTIEGSDGADLIIGGQGSDEIDGGTGRDMVDYRGSTAGVQIDLREVEAFGGDAEGDLLSGIESLRGTAFADVLTGNATANVLRGSGGADLVDGGAGNDTLRGDGGADTLNGGAGTDTVTYAGSFTAISLNLVTGAGFGGQAQGDLLQSVENVIGSEAADRLTGDIQANVLNGGGDGDTLEGRAGNDTLIGGLGGGGDTFLFNTNEGSDTITDFEIGRDVVDISAYGFAALAEVLARVSVAANGVDQVLDLNTVAFSARITFQNLLFADATQIEDAILWN